MNAVGDFDEVYNVEEVDEDVIRGAEDLISPSRVVQLESNPFGLELANEQPSAVKSASNVLRI